MAKLLALKKPTFLCSGLIMYATHEGIVNKIIDHG